MNRLLDRLAPSATDMIRADHEHVVAMFHQYRLDGSARTRQALVESACLAIEVHAQLEEEIFYPAMRELAADAPEVDESLSEHAEARQLIALLRSSAPSDPGYDDAFLQLMRSILHHVADEETRLLPDAERRLGAHRLAELGARMTRRRLELFAPRAGALARNTLSSTHAAYAVVAGGAMIGASLAAKRLLGR